MFRMLLPASAGGDEIEPWTYLSAVEALAEADASVAWNVFVGNSAALIAPFIPLESARTIFGNPRAVVAWGPPNECRARAVPGGYLVSGKWHFASGCRQATWMGAHCPIVEPDGSLRPNQLGRPAIRTLLFPVDQARRLENWNTIGLRGTASDAYTVDEVLRPRSVQRHARGPTLRRDPRPALRVSHARDLFRRRLRRGLGTARAMLDAFMAWRAQSAARTQAARGQRRRASRSRAQRSQARRRPRLPRHHAARNLEDHHRHRDHRNPRSRARAPRLRHAIHRPPKSRITPTRPLAWTQSTPGAPLERRFRDIHTLTQQIQARAAHFEAVGQVLLGLDVGMFY